MAILPKQLKINNMGWYEDQEINAKRAKRKTIALRISENQEMKLKLIAEYMKANRLKDPAGAYYVWDKDMTTAKIIRFLIEDFDTTIKREEK